MMMMKTFHRSIFYHKLFHRRLCKHLPFVTLKKNLLMENNLETNDYFARFEYK
jgi:hypothetical protein